MRKSIKTKTYITINYTLHVTQDGVFNTHICFPIFAIFNSGNPYMESSVTNKRSLLPIHEEMVLVLLFSKVVTQQTSNGD